MSKVILLAALLLSACTESGDASKGYEMPEGLKDCKVYTVAGSWKQTLYVVRCPHLTTTAWDEYRSCGKNCHTTEHFALTVQEEE